MNAALHLLGPTRTVPGEQHERLTAACSGFDAPVAVLDVAAMSANAHDLLRRASGKPIRVASKSIRSVDVLTAVLALDGYAGVLAFTLEEAIMLARSGVSNDIVVAYPTVASNALRTLLGSAELLTKITLMIDHPQQLRIIHQTLKPVAVVRVCLDLDMSMKVGPLHVGTRRSPIHTVAQVRAAAEFITAHQTFRLVGLMGYEAQIAGVTDDSMGRRAMKRVSQPEVTTRRGGMVRAVQQVLTQRGHRALEFVNGGGTGSLESTTSDPAVTEVAAGSGLYGPHLFDRYHQFTPYSAAFFGLDVVRIPAPGIVTVLGGGWIASGAPGPDRLPDPVYPQGLRYTATEGAGEVQTPLRTTAYTPHIGERIWFRHTKAGELAEHVTHFQLLTDRRITGSVTTYRGDGYAFL